jgi:hypothetical protein
MRRFAVLSLLALVVMSCESNRLPTERDNRIAAARIFTRRFALSSLSAWNVRASAAAEDCGVLFITTTMNLDEPMIETMHYGTGVYDVNRGGVQRFCRERSFRGVAYRDGSGHTWTYGATDRAEAAAMKPCQ